MQNNYDVIIVGGGIAGLSCGALLSNKGFKVCILEKNSTIGGRVRVIEKEGFTIDYGLHVNRFAHKGKCAEVLVRLNKKPEFIYPGKPVVFHQKEFHNFPSRPYHFLKAFLQKSKVLSTKTKLKFLKIFTSAPFVSPEKFKNLSLYDFLIKYEPTQELLDISSLFCGIAFICPDLSKISALEVGEFFRKALTVRHHISYLKGGWKKLLDTLEEEIKKNGKIITNCNVQQIEILQDRVSKVLTEFGEFTAKSYICTVPFGNIKDIIDINKLSSTLKKYAISVEPTSGVTIDFILSKPASSKSGIIITYEPLTLGYFISNFTKPIGVDKKQLGQWYLYIPPDKIKDRKYAKGQIQVLKNLLSEMFPNIWDNLVWERAMILDIVDGAVPKVGQGWKDRPQFISNISNLFFAGDSTGGFGWGSEISFDSAIKCSEIVRRYLCNMM